MKYGEVKPAQTTNGNNGSIVTSIQSKCIL